MKIKALSTILILLCILSLNLQSQDLLKLIESGDIERIQNSVEKDSSIIDERITSTGWTILIYAVNKKHVELVKYLVEAGADINKKSFNHWSPLTRAVEINHEELTNYFISLNANIPINEDRSSRLIHKASKGGLGTLVNLMVEKGEDINALDKDGNTLLHSTTIGGLFKAAQKLIDMGMDVDRKNNYELTSLHFASMTGNKNMLELLIKNGANPNAKSMTGKSPLVFAKEKGHRDLVQILLPITSNQTVGEFPVLKGDYLGMEKPGMKAELFAPDIISTTQEEHGVCVFSNDGNEVYWQRKNISGLNTVIMYMKRINGIWQKPESIKYSEGYHNGNPTLSLDNQTLFYASTYTNKNEGISGGVNILYHTRTKNGWSKPMFIGSPVNSNSWDECFIETNDGSLYFNSSRKGGYGYADLYKSEFRDGKYQNPLNLGDKVNGKSFDCYVYVSKDRKFLIYESYKEDGFGSGDLYISFKQDDGSWGEAINLGDKVNTKHRETFPMISPDGKYFFFSSTRKGNLDAYWIDIRAIELLHSQFD